MKKFDFCVLVAALLVVLLAGCEGEVKYYHTESSESLAVESVADPVPSYVFGENGFYDTVNDVEYLRVPGVWAKEKGDVYLSEGDVTFYKVEGVHESYFLCDGNGSVFKNSLLPWIEEPGTDGWAEAYPALIDDAS